MPKNSSISEDGPCVSAFTRGYAFGIACPKCDVRMSRRYLKKPSADTGLVEEIYRCPKCGLVTARWVDE